MARIRRSTATDHTLTIKLPSSAKVPEVLRDSEYVRYVLAGTLYTRGLLSGKEARALTGDNRRTFEEKMARHGFPLLPDDEETAARELHATI